MVKSGCSNFQNFFLIIGAQKAGSASLNKFLNQHPHLQSAWHKEVNFFSSDINYRNGLSWYKKQFPVSLGKKLFYESTPEYLYYPFVPERIKTFNPYIKMIVLLREPVERAYSAWNMFKKIYKVNKEVVIKKYFSLTNPDIRIAMTDFLNSPYYKSFEECVNEEMERINDPFSLIEPSFVRRGIYYDQLKRYYCHFSKNQIIIIEKEELQKRIIKTLNKILEFLELPPIEWKTDELSNANEGTYDAPINVETKNLLNNFYKPYNEKLYHLINRNFSW